MAVRLHGGGQTNVVEEYELLSTVWYGAITLNKLWISRCTSPVHLACWVKASPMAASTTSLQLHMG